MAFLKKRVHNQAYKNSCSDKTRENNEVCTPILQSLFSNIKKNRTESVFTDLYDYTSVSSPVCAIETSFDTETVHSLDCPTETKKPTNINLYTRYNTISCSNIPTYYLAWYNVIISTGYRNQQAVCCASVKINVSTIVGSTGFMCPLQKNTCCETVYTTNIETVENIEDSIYLDSIDTKTTNTPEEISLSSIFIDFYNVLLSVFEDMYPSCIMFGLNNMIIKNIQIDTNKIFSTFLEKIKDRYIFFYRPLNDNTTGTAYGSTDQEGNTSDSAYGDAAQEGNTSDSSYGDAAQEGITSGTARGDTPLTDHIQKIVSWLESSQTETPLECLESVDDSLDFLRLLE
jgi:hypothetical protein